MTEDAPTVKKTSPEVSDQLFLQKKISLKSLYKEIMDSNNPDPLIRSLPAQTLYYMIQEKGLQTCTDLILAASIEQCKSILDFDLWKRDSFNEDRFWEWLALTDENSDLEILQKFLKFIDLKLVAKIMDQYLEVFISDEATDTPPDIGFVTPDKGFTWTKVTLENADQYFLLNRFLALIFETSPELFYQLLSIRNVATPSILEEECYLERISRLTAEGVPDYDFSAKIHAILSPKEALNMAEQEGMAISKIVDIEAVLPLVVNPEINDHLFNLYKSAIDKETFLAELTLITNAAIVFFTIDFNDKESVSNISRQVQSTLAIGIQTLLENSKRTSSDLIYEKISLQGFYRVGLYEMNEFKKFAKKILLESDIKDPKPLSALNCLNSKLPSVPEWFKNNDFSNDVSSERVFSCSLNDLKELKDFITKNS